MAALLCSDCPDQLLWHTKGLVRHGGSLDQARFAQDLGIAVAQACGCKTNGITKLEEIDFESSQAV
ncbi:uncharacterized protein A1O9_02562 [Exophiala aquamarina CBS 119918]|uniref:Uncharacterized protein n=1 Tax=Exophiala aquamarina CBS 119918 TaxID=1182545 RepID=A0A072PNS6_9EURO|nr:uncharacterized protein A1O9_02562 [Exophiala aquamarina CBS 119918]KEF60998.1 hypothetical protein A1O9_02562 [Exophiala aquamarina CBS 119918]